MLRGFAFLAALALPAVAAAQQPCTTNGQRVVDEVYRRVLERPLNGDNSAMVQRLTAGDISVHDAVRQVATSPEHMQRFVNPRNEAELRNSVTTLYRHLLGRQPDPAGLEAHMGAMRTQGARAVIDAMLNSDEYRIRFGDTGVPGTQVRYCGARAALDNSNQSTPRFRNLDRNRDGRVTRDEWSGTAWAFASSDLNGDGVLTADEVPGNGGNAVVGTTGTLADADAVARFEALDRNRNGRIERREWTGTAAEFDRIDTNRNNLLSVAEVAAGTAEPESFDSLDWNRDGRLTIEEWNWNRRSFQEQDTNGDGVLTRREFRGQPVNNRNGF